MCQLRLISEHFKVGFKHVQFEADSRVQEFFGNIRAGKILAVGVGLNVFLYNDVKPLWFYRSYNPGLSTLLNFPSPTNQA